MLAPIVSGRRSFDRTRSLEHFFEVQTTRGVVDVLFADVAHGVMDERRRFGLVTLTELAPVAVLRAMTAISSRPRPFPAGEIAELVPFSVSHVRRAILPGLESCGWIAQAEGGKWVLNHPYRIPVRKLIAVEVKRSKWRVAVRQAISHTEFADATYVALDAARMPTADSWERPFAFAGLGVLSVGATSASPDDPTARVTRVICAVRQRPHGLARAVVAERVAALSESGATAGQVRHVFGQFVTSAWGADPRLGPLTPS